MTPRAACLGLAMLTAACAQSQMLIDGEFEDWEGVPVSAQDGPDDFILDLRSVSLRHDDRSVYVRLELAHPVNLQVLPEGSIRLLLDADLNPASGMTWSNAEGTDWAIEFSPPRTDGKEPERYGARFLVAGKGESAEEKSIHSLDLAVSPTISSRVFEMRIPRDPEWLSSALGFDLTVVASDAAGRPFDSLPRVPYRYAAHAPVPNASGSRSSLSRPSSDHLRVLTWNVADEYFVQRFDRFKQVVDLLEPDVLLLDEAPRDVSEQQLRLLVSGIPGSDDWWTHIGRGGGRQRCAVVSRYPLTPLPAFDPLPYGREVIRATRTGATARMAKDARTMHVDGMPVAGVSIRWQERTLLAVLADLQCCGRDASPEDVFRGAQMAMLRNALDATVARTAPDGLIIAGDFNLVGSNLPMEIALTGGDLDRSDLKPVDAFQPDGITNATYGFSGPFPPGRLDYVVYSDSSLLPINSFVFDSRDLAADWLAGYGLAPDSSTQISDHMPIVVDFAWAFAND